MKIARIEIRTADIAWASRRATPGRDGRVVVDADSVERIQFAGTEMVRFDLGNNLPCDAANRWYVSPAAWIV